MHEEITVHNLLIRLPKGVKRFISIFLLAISFGYGTGVLYIYRTSGSSVNQMEEEYLGNENNPEAVEMKFQKSEGAMLTLIHGHMVSFSLIFLVMGTLVLLTSYSNPVRYFLAIEPLISTITTFGGIYLMWNGIIWMKYVVIVSGFFMHCSFLGIVILVLRDLRRKDPPTA